MLTFNLFALMALSLFTTIMAVTAMRRERKELQYSSLLLDSVIELEGQLTSLYERVYESESRLVEKTQQIHDLQVALFETKESTKDLLESYQEEIQDLEDQVKDLDHLKSVHQAEISQLSWDLSTYEKVCSPEQLDAEEELAIARQCIWDKQQQVADKVELLNEVAAELYSLGFKDSISPNEIFKIRELALGQDIPF